MTLQAAEDIELTVTQWLGRTMPTTAALRDLSYGTELPRGNVSNFVQVRLIGAQHDNTSYTYRIDFRMWGALDVYGRPDSAGKAERMRKARTLSAIFMRAFGGSLWMAPTEIPDDFDNGSGYHILFTVAITRKARPNVP